jgi:broad specificity phosphatase PhoE
MGQCMSPPSLSNESRDDGICVIEIVRANHLPNMDVGSLTDAYVLIHITGEGGNAKLHDAKLSTLDRSNCLDPVFHSYQAFAFIPYDTDQVTFEVLDRDTLKKDDKIGYATLTFEELKKNSGELTLPLTMSTSLKSLSGEASSVTVRLVTCGPRPVQPGQKEIFVIRHGESKWNDSQAEKNIKGMVSQYDHELTAQGIEQAESFNGRWKAAKDSRDGDPDIDTFLAADAIYASPLTRATQTALLTCEDHPLLANEGPGLSLLRNIREVKNFGSFDTVGRFTGQDIRSHVEATLTKDMGVGRSRKVMMTTIDCNDAIGSWWTPLEVKENKEDVRARFRDVYSFLRYGTSANTIILVGHSHFFRFMMSEYMSKEFRQREPEWTDKLAVSKLDNGACLRLTLQWEDLEDPMANPAVVNARLVFGSQLVEEAAHSKKK